MQALWSSGGRSRRLWRLGERVQALCSSGESVLLRRKCRKVSESAGEPVRALSRLRACEGMVCGVALPRARARRLTPAAHRRCELASRAEPPLAAPPGVARER